MRQIWKLEAVGNPSRATCIHNPLEIGALKCTDHFLNVFSIPSLLSPFWLFTINRFSDDE